VKAQVYWKEPAETAHSEKKRDLSLAD